MDIQTALLIISAQPNTFSCFLESQAKGAINYAQEMQSHWYECAECKKPCDVKIPNASEKQVAPVQQEPTSIADKQNCATQTPKIKCCGAEVDKCVWCGKSYEEHMDKANPNATAKVPCLLLKSHFFTRLQQKPNSVTERLNTRNKWENKLWDLGYLSQFQCGQLTEIIKQAVGEAVEAESQRRVKVVWNEVCEQIRNEAIDEVIKAIKIAPVDLTISNVVSLLQALKLKVKPQK